MNIIEYAIKSHVFRVIPALKKKEDSHIMDAICLPHKNSWALYYVHKKNKQTE